MSSIVKLSHKLFSPGRGDPNVAGGGVKRNPRVCVPKDFPGKLGSPPPVPLRRSPPTAWLVFGFVGAYVEAGISARRHFRMHFIRGLRCAPPPGYARVAPLGLKRGSINSSLQPEIAFSPKNDKICLSSHPHQNHFFHNTKAGKRKFSPPNTRQRSRRPQTAQHRICPRLTAR